MDLEMEIDNMEEGETKDLAEKMLPKIKVSVMVRKERAKSSLEKN